MGNFSDIGYDPSIRTEYMNSILQSSIPATFRFKRGDFITYYEPVVKANVVINVQDFYWTTSRYVKHNEDSLRLKRWIYYKAFNLDRKHLYYDGSRLGIVLEEYTNVRHSTQEEIEQYMKALREEGLTL